MQAHPWFNGVDWDRIYHIEAAFIPEVNDELDTQNFEKFEEVLVYLIIFKFQVVSTVMCSSAIFHILQSENHTHTSSKSGPWRKVLFLMIIYECILKKVICIFCCSILDFLRRYSFCAIFFILLFPFLFCSIIELLVSPIETCCLRGYII